MYFLYIGFVKMSARVFTIIMIVMIIVVAMSIMMQMVNRFSVCEINNIRRCRSLAIRVGRCRSLAIRVEGY